jgi:hypothetical protein
MSLVAKKHTYDMSASSPAATVNGAKVRLQLKPEGTDGPSFALSAMVVGAGFATLDGPFAWRIEATGESGKQEALIVHRLRTLTSLTKRDEWYPAQHLGRRVDFRVKKGETGPPKAVYEIPGRLDVKPRVDGVLDVLADLTVITQGKRERKTVKFRLDPSQKRADEFIFLPAEIVNSIGKGPDDWEDRGWD